MSAKSLTDESPFVDKFNLLVLNTIMDHDESFPKIDLEQRIDPAAYQALHKSGKTIVSRYDRHQRLRQLASRPVTSILERLSHHKVMYSVLGGTVLAAGAVVLGTSDMHNDKAAERQAAQQQLHQNHVDAIKEVLAHPGQLAAIGICSVELSQEALMAKSPSDITLYAKAAASERTLNPDCANNPNSDADGIEIYNESDGSQTLVTRQDVLPRLTGEVPYF